PYGRPASLSVWEARVLELVREHDGLFETELPVAEVDRGRDRALVHRAIDLLERNAGRQDLGQESTADRGRRVLVRVDAVDLLANPNLDLSVQLDRVRLVGTMHFLDVREPPALALRADALASHVVDAEHDVLRRHDARLAVRGRENVVRRHHQGARLELRLDRQRHVHRHLVAVEVRVERGADERVQLDRLALDQHGLERLNAQAVQRRRAVQHHRMLADHLLEDVPNLGTLALDEPLRGLDGRRLAAQLELREDERLEELERELLRQAALVQLQRRADDNDRAARVVDALAEQVLPEPALLALDHVGERLERTLVRARDRAAAATVVEQCVHRLLEHALLVAHDDVGRVEL